MDNPTSVPSGTSTPEPPEEPPTTLSDQAKEGTLVVIRNHKRPYRILPRTERRRLIYKVWEMRMVLRMSPHEVCEQLDLPAVTERWYFRVAKSMYARQRGKDTYAEDRAEEFMIATERRIRLLYGLYQQAAGRPWKAPDPAKQFPGQKEILPNLDLQKEILKEIREEEKQLIVIGQTLGKLNRVPTPLPTDPENAPVTIVVKQYVIKNHTEIHTNGGPEQHLPTGGEIPVLPEPEEHQGNGSAPHPDPGAEL